MLRSPAVAGKFYPENPAELLQQIRNFVRARPGPPQQRTQYRACLVPHAGYVYSGSVAGAVYERISFPKRIIVLGVRHFPYGEEAAILSEGLWRTPLGDAQVDSELAARLLRTCPVLREDPIAHEREHSLEVQLPFLQVLRHGFTFIPIALGTIRFDELVSVGQSLGKILLSDPDILLLTTSDCNHYEDDATTRRKDHLAIEQILRFDPRGLFDVCRKHDISMCGLGPTVALLTALNLIGVKNAELVKYATSADVSGDTSAVVGYAGILFR
ncbi:MAG TPA: AmmeMemoRadiSam system protein B [Candidatus Acidoferrum sp.]|jgi:AmmeMemoRadiSam system protein B